MKSLTPLFICSALALGAVSAAPRSALAEPAKPAQEKAVKTARSVASKLYWAAKLMDKHENWTQVSELLREILDLGLDNAYVNSRITAVKQYVDREAPRQLKGKLFGSRLDTHSFLEARLLIVECIQEMRPRLNLSWTGEVRHLKKMLFSSIFPHAEEYGEIEFPAPSTYSFDSYGYTLKNLRALMITPGGKDLSPRFKAFLPDPKAKNFPAPKDDDDFGSTMYFKRLTVFKDHIHSDLMAEGVDPDKIIPDGGWDPTGNGPGWGRGGDWDPGDDDWDWRRRSETEERLLALKRAYRYLKKALDTMRNHRSIDEYEPLTLLMVAVSNPGLLEFDPQLRDFVAGVKLKFKVPLDGVDQNAHRPHDYELVQHVNDALIPGGNVRLQYEVDGKTGQTVLYLVSNLNGESNIAFNLLSFRNIAMFIQTARYMPDGVIGFAKATPENLAKLSESINKMIENWNRSDNILYRLVGRPAQVVFDIVVTVGGKSISRAATATTKLLQRLAANPRVLKAYGVVKSERFLKTLIAAAVACDVTAAAIELWDAPDSGAAAKIVIHRGSRVGATLVYLSKYRPAILITAAFDIGNLIYNKIPSTAEIFEYGVNYGYGKLYTLARGYSPREKELRELKRQLTIEEQSEALTMLADYEKASKAAATLDEMRAAKAKLAERLGLYAARRLVFHYVTVTALNGRGERTLGLELRAQSEEYDRVFWTWFNAPGSGLKEQAGLAVLDREFDQKWVKLGGKLPEKPKPETPKTPPAPDGEKKKKSPVPDDGDEPWENSRGAYNPKP